LLEVSREAKFGTSTVQGGVFAGCGDQRWSEFVEQGSPKVVSESRELAVSAVESGRMKAETSCAVICNCSTGAVGYVLYLHEPCLQVEKFF
jgi:hypothetical protein